MDAELIIGPEIIRAYERLSYKTWYALAEFVDNSTQSYFDNRELFERLGERLEVSITYDRTNGTIRIVDNAFGMSQDELTNALQIGLPPRDTTGRCEFGMGLKTSACWFGKKWSITTKQYGHDYEYHVLIDVEKIASGHTKLDPKEPVKRDSDLHYTIIQIEQLNRGLRGWAKKNSRDYLAAIYRRDILDGILDLKFDNASIAPDIRYEDDDFLKRVDGSLYRVEIDAMLNDKQVVGWVGVLAPGRAGRQRAGITIFRRNRALATWRNAWRPEEIFGAQRNDLINQRLTGEIALDEFTVSHTKDAILFEDDEEEQLCELIMNSANDAELIRVAREHRGESDVAPTEAEIQVALDELKREMESPDFVDSISIAEVPRPEIEQIKAEPLVDDAKSKSTQPRLTVSVGESLTVHIYLAKYSYNDPYYAFEISPHADSILIAVNESHPGWLELAGEEAVRTYLKHVTFDAIAEWKCLKKTAPLNSGSIRQIKDDLFRQSFFGPGDRDA